MFTTTCSPPSTSALPAVAVDSVRELVFVHGGIHIKNGSVERKLFIFDLVKRQWIDQDKEDRSMLGSTGNHEDMVRRIAPYSPSLESLVRSAQQCCVSSTTSSTSDVMYLQMALENLRRAMIGQTGEASSPKSSSGLGIKSEGHHVVGATPVVGVKRERDNEEGAGKSKMALRRVASVVSPSTAPARFGHVAWVFNRSTLLIHGGADSDTNRKAGGSGDVFAFHTKSGIWERLSRQIGGCEAPAMFGHSLLPLHTHIQFSHARRRERELARRTRRKERLAPAHHTRSPVPIVREDESDDDSVRSESSSSEEDSEAEGMDWLPLSQRGIFCMIGSVDVRQVRRASSSPNRGLHHHPGSHSHIVSLYVLCLSSVVGTRWVHVDTNLTAAALGSSKTNKSAVDDGVSAIMKFPHRQHFVITPSDPRASFGGGRGTLTGGSVGQGVGGGHQSSAGGHTEEEALLIGGTLSMVDFFLLGGETPQGTSLHDLYFFNASVGVWRSVCVFHAEGAVGERLPSPLSFVSLQPWCAKSEHEDKSKAIPFIFEPSPHLSHKCPFAIHVVPKNFKRDDDSTGAAASGTLGFLLVGVKNGVMVVDLSGRPDNHLEVCGTVHLSSRKNRDTPERMASRITGAAYTKMTSTSDENLKPQMNVELCGFFITSSELMKPCTLSLRYSLEHHVAANFDPVTAPLLAALIEDNNSNPSPLQSEGAPSETDSLLDALLNEDHEDEIAVVIPEDAVVPVTERPESYHDDDDLLDDLLMSGSDDEGLIDELLTSE